MPAVTRALHPALAPYVASCVGYDERPGPDAVHHGLPSPTLTVVLAFDEPLDCGWQGDAQTRHYWTLVGGLHDSPALIRTHGHQHGIQLALTPTGARTLLDLPAGELCRSLIRAEDISGPRATFPAGLHARLAEATWPDRFALLEQHLLTRVGGAGRRDPMAPAVARAWQLVLASGGRMPVAEVAAQVGWSRRQLQTRFVGEFGLGPKRLGQVARFTHAQRLARAGVPLAEVAQRAGYADQSHLHRDWRTLAGQTPTASAEDFPIVLSSVDDERGPSST